MNYERAHARPSVRDVSTSCCRQSLVYSLQSILNLLEKVDEKISSFISETTEA